MRKLSLIPTFVGLLAFPALAHDTACSQMQPSDAPCAEPPTQASATHQAPADAEKTPDQQATYDSWPAEQKAKFDAWAAETQDYYWSLTPERQKTFWRLSETDMVALARMDEQQRSAAWESIEKQIATDSQPGSR